jgi:Fur family zinc uptake transcriptional regulator
MASLLAFKRHDHRHCIEQALQEAEQLCARREARLTPLRRRVLELVWQNHQPSGAYQLLDQLAAGSASRVAPATVYRALDFLQEQGLVHRLASLNAYIGCPHAERHHRGHFLICRHCQATVEITSSQVAEAIDASARAAGFEAEEEWVEVLGVCAGCRGRGQ